MGKTTPHRSETRHRALAVPSRTPLTRDPAQSHRALQPRSPRRSPAGRDTGKWRAQDTRNRQAQRQPRRHRRTRGCRQPTVVAASHSAHYGLRPGDAQQEGRKVGGQLREHDDRTGNRAEHVLNQRADIRTRRHPGDAQQEGIKVGLQLRERDDRTGTRGQHVLNHGAHIRNWPDHIRNRRHRIRHRRDLVRNHVDRLRNRGTAVRHRRDLVRNRVDRLRNRGTAVRVVLCPVLGVRAARLVVRLFGSGRRLLAWLATRAKRAVLGARAARLVVRLFGSGGMLLAWLATRATASRPWCPCRQARPSAFSRGGNSAGLKRWFRDHRAQRNLWNRDRRRRPRPLHPAACPLRAHKFLQRGANAIDPPSSVRTEAGHIPPWTRRSGSSLLSTRSARRRFNDRRPMPDDDGLAAVHVSRIYADYAANQRFRPATRGISVAGRVG